MAVVIIILLVGATKHYRKSPECCCSFFLLLVGPMQISGASLAFMILFDWSFVLTELCWLINRPSDCSVDLLSNYFPWINSVRANNPIWQIFERILIDFRFFARQCLIAISLVKQENVKLGSWCVGWVLNWTRNLISRECWKLFCSSASWCSKAVCVLHPPCSLFPSASEICTETNEMEVRLHIFGLKRITRRWEQIECGFIFVTVAQSTNVSKRIFHMLWHRRDNDQSDEAFHPRMLIKYNLLAFIFVLRETNWRRHASRVGNQFLI